MTRGFAASVINTWLDTVFATASCWVKLHIGDPGAAGAGNPAVGDATRKQATMAAAAGGSKAASAAVGPWTNAGATETISDISLWTLVSAGTFNASGPLAASQAWVATNTLTLTALTVSVTPVAA